MRARACASIEREIGFMPKCRKECAQLRIRLDDKRTAVQFMSIQLSLTPKYWRSR